MLACAFAIRAQIVDAAAPTGLFMKLKLAIRARPGNRAGLLLCGSRLIQ
jgi:hypothetical protein